MQGTEPSKAILTAVQPFRSQDSPTSESDIWMMRTPNCFVEQLSQCVDGCKRVQVKPGRQLGGYAGGAPFP